MQSHPRHSLQLDVGIPHHEHDPQEHTARPRANNDNHDHLLDFDHQHASSSYSSLSSTNPSAAAPGLPKGLSRPLSHQEQEKLAVLDRLKFFLATAPSRWNPSQSGISGSQPPQQHPHTPSHPALNRFLLPSQEFVTCVYWNELYHITGTDIVRALVFRFEAFGRPVRNMKKFEEGVFSDLRNLKPGQDACLEEPKSPFLDLLFKYQCIRTQKKQKVFYWFSVPHDRLFLDALERDLKREKMGLEPTTIVVGEPALSFVYDSSFKRSLYDQFVRAAGGKEGEGDLERALRGINVDPAGSAPSSFPVTGAGGEDDGADSSGISDVEGTGTVRPRTKGKDAPFFNMLSLFEGSPTYKQRRKKTPNRPSPLAVDSDSQNGHGYGSSGYTDNMGYLNVPGIAMPTLPSSAPPDYETRGRYADAYPYDGGLHHTGPSSFGPEVKQEPVSAAEMFMAQARGELHPPTRHNSASAISQSHVTPHVNKRHSYGGTTALSSQDDPEGIVDPATVGVWYEGKFAGSGVGAGANGRPHDLPRAQSAHGSIRIPQQGEGSGADAPGQDGGRSLKAKAYGCPLLSCERLFKRPEHLMKHLETHANDAAGRGKGGENGERGFESMNVGEWINNIDEEEAGSGPTSSPPSSNTHGSGSQDAGDTEMSEIRVGEDAEAMGRRSRNMFSGAAVTTPAELAASIANGGHSLEMCEVELDGDLLDVTGDEEGLVRVANSAGIVQEPHSMEDAHRFSFNVPIPGRSEPQRTSSYDSYGSSYESGSYYPSNHVDVPPNTGDWMRATPSPAFSTVSIPPGSSAGYPQRPMTGFSGRSSRQSSRSRPSSGMFDLNIYDSASAVTASAPSHKVGFDHGSLLPPNVYSGSESGSNSVSSSYSSSSGIPHSSPAIPAQSHAMSMDSGMNGAHQSLLLGSSSLNGTLNGGPVRRHRSMTPSLYGSGRVPHGRPVSSSGHYPAGGRSSPGAGELASSIGYHPYANRSTSAISAHSSPSPAYVDLPRRSDSRASNHMMRPGSAASMHSAFGGEIYRTDSPVPYSGGMTGTNGGGMMTDSPAAFAIDLPAMGNTAMYGQNVPSQGSTPYMGRAHLEGGGYYPQHVSTM
ncbi:hypothetical protein AAF712_004637 [Marasmius tenuissimus]|uniref:C2H2-type domain-containing protein n=1 Tax=Marasmius tenuissimus TaxID=585030 RepID=A0ABR3A2Q2_9AGAR